MRGIQLPLQREREKRNVSMSSGRWQLWDLSCVLKGMAEDALAVAPGAIFISVPVPSSHCTETSAPFGVRTASKQPT